LLFAAGVLRAPPSARVFDLLSEALGEAWRLEKHDDTLAYF